MFVFAGTDDKTVAPPSVTLSSPPPIFVAGLGPLLRSHRCKRTLKCILGASELVSIGGVELSVARRALPDILEEFDIHGFEIRFLVADCLLL